MTAAGHPAEFGLAPIERGSGDHHADHHGDHHADQPGRFTRPQALALSWIEAYQRAFAGRPSPCRFYPSCSTYAHEAFAVHGTRRGALLTVRRLLRCRPLGPSGFDPVPEPAGDQAPDPDRAEKGR